MTLIQCFDLPAWLAEKHGLDVQKLLTRKPGQRFEPHTRSRKEKQALAFGRLTNCSTLRFCNLFERERERAQQLQLARAHIAHFSEGDLLRALGHLDQSTSARLIAGLYGFLILTQ